MDGRMTVPTNYDMRCKGRSRSSRCRSAAVALCQSSRRQRAGSTREARSAGPLLATSAVRLMTETVAARESGSVTQRRAVPGRNPNIDAVVGLDASWTLGANNYVVGSPWFGPELNHVPGAALRRPLEEDSEVPSWVGELPDVRVVEVPGSDHGAFSDDPGMRAFLGQRPAADRNAHRIVAKSAFASRTAYCAARVVARDDAHVRREPRPTSGTSSSRMQREARTPPANRRDPRSQTPDPSRRKPPSPREP